MVLGPRGGVTVGCSDGNVQVAVLGISLDKEEGARVVKGLFPEDGIGRGREHDDKAVADLDGRCPCPRSLSENPGLTLSANAHWNVRSGFARKSVLAGRGL